MVIFCAHIRKPKFAVFFCGNKFECVYMYMVWWLEKVMYRDGKLLIIKQRKN